MIGREEWLILLYVIYHPITINAPKNRILRKVGNQKAINHTEGFQDIRTINRDFSVCNKLAVENTSSNANIKEFAVTQSQSCPPSFAISMVLNKLCR